VVRSGRLVGQPWLVAVPEALGAEPSSSPWALDCWPKLAPPPVQRPVAERPESREQPIAAELTLEQ
jgi:hypothetical protein